MAPTPRWPPGPGVLELPDGRTVRGRGLRRGPAPDPAPQLGLYLLGSAPPSPGWPARWIRWRDFRSRPDDVGALADALRETLERCGAERIEIACGGGRGRTGTALACLCVLAGVPADQAVAYVRAGYDRRAVETPGQRRFLRSFT